MTNPPFITATSSSALILLLSMSTGWSTETGASQADGITKRFATFPVESMQWCDITAKEFRQRVGASKVSEAYVTPNELGLVAGYWIDTADGAAIALICFDKTALAFGQRNPNHIKKGSFLANVSRRGPKCPYPERKDIFHQDKNLTIFWTNENGQDDVTICITGVTSITLSRARV